MPVSADASASVNVMVTTTGLKYCDVWLDQRSCRDDHRVHERNLHGHELDPLYRLDVVVSGLCNCHDGVVGSVSQSENGIENARVCMTCDDWGNENGPTEVRMCFVCVVAAKVSVCTVFRGDGKSPSLDVARERVSGSDLGYALSSASGTVYASESRLCLCVVVVNGRS